MGDAWKAIQTVLWETLKLAFDIWRLESFQAKDQTMELLLIYSLQS